MPVLGRHGDRNGGRKLYETSRHENFLQNDREDVPEPKSHQQVSAIPNLSSCPLRLQICFSNAMAGLVGGGNGTVSRDAEERISLPAHARLTTNPPGAFLRRTNLPHPPTPFPSSPHTTKCNRRRNAQPSLPVPGQIPRFSLPSVI
jgi:hypothetical protein